MVLGWQTIALIAGTAGLLIGVPLARRSHQARPLISGGGQVFHYLACAAMGAVPVAILTGVVATAGKSGLFVALGLLVGAALMLVIHAVPEYFALRRHE